MGLGWERALSVLRASLLRKLVTRELGNVSRRSWREGEWPATASFKFQMCDVVQRPLARAVLASRCRETGATR